MRFKPVFAGVVILFGPLLSFSLLWLTFPGFVTRHLAEYTRLRFQPVIGKGASGLFQEGLGLYCQRVVIDLVTETWNILGPALLWAALAVALTLLTHFAMRKYRRSLLNRLGELTAFLFLLLIMTLSSKAPQPVLLLCAGVGLYGLNFLISFSGRGRRTEKRRLLLPVVLLSGSLPGVAQVLAPVPLLLWFAKLLRPSSLPLEKAAIRGGRLIVCLFTFPALALLAFSGQDTPLPPQVRQLLSAPNLYDIELDYPANRLIVTLKTGGTGFLLRLDSLEMLRAFSLPSAELEDIALDPEAREIFHVDRFNKTLFVWDADTLQVLRTGPISRPSSGTTKLALNRPSGRLLVSFENDNLFAVDCHTLDGAFMGAPGNVNMVTDERYPLVYLGSEMHSWVAAVDMKTCREASRAPGPLRGDKMALSEKRNELYAPDPVRGKIWVYSIPELKLLRKIPAQFGVRTLAVDDVNGLLLAASVVTGYVEVLDPESGRRLNRYYAGKYCRNMKTDPPTRRAFITLTRDGLYVINY